MRRAGIPVAILAILIVAGVLSGCAHGRMSGEVAVPSGVQLHYTDEGRGEPVILVHGFAVDSELNWRALGISGALAKHYRVITFDVRGHGKSDKPHDPAQYGLELVEDVVRIMDHLGLPKAHVAGYSLGGFITLKLMMLHPDRLLSAAPCAAGWERREGEHMRMLSEAADRLEAGEGFKMILRELDPKDTPWAAVRILVVDACLRYLNDTHAMAAAVRSLAALEVTETELRANRVPALTIVGSEDALKKGVDDMTGILANHEVVVIPNANHHSAIKRREFVNALKQFLDAH